MKNETLTLIGTVCVETAERACARLKVLPGVLDATFFADPARLCVSLDDAAPSRAELETELARAGLLVEAERRTHASGGCCGGCGS